MTWVASSLLKAQSPAGIVRLSGAIDAIVPADAKIEKLAEGFKFIEGPVWAHQGYLLFSDIPRNLIMQYTPDGKVTEYRASSGYDRVPPAGSYFGSNGLTLDRQGRLTICEQGNRRVTRIEATGKVTVLADRYQGKRLNSPNDLVYKSDGAIYFTDPPYALPKEFDDPARELPFSGVFRVKDGSVQLVAKDLTGPNGLAFSPDESYLYVSNSGPERKLWMRYPVNPDGTLGAGQVFVDVTTSKEAGVPDGMKCDRRGNLYCTGPGGIWIISPEGKHLGTIRLPELPANCNWGGADGKTLYMTAKTSLYRVTLLVEGVRP